MRNYLNNTNVLTKLAVPLATVAALGAMAPAQAGSIGLAPGLFSSDGLLSIQVAPDGLGGFTTTADFGQNGFGNPELNRPITVAQTSPIAAPDTGAFASFFPGGTIDIKDIQFTVPVAQPPSIPLLVNNFLDLNPDNPPGGGQNTFDLQQISRPFFIDIAGFGSSLAIGGSGVYKSSDPAVGNQLGVVNFQMVLPGLSVAQFQALLASGTPVNQNYTLTGTLDTVVVPEPASTTALVGLGLLGMSATIRKRRNLK